MRIIKLALISFLFFALLLFLLGLLIPSEVRISKAINLDRKQNGVLSLVKDTTLWPLWHPAYKKDIVKKQRIEKVEASDTMVVMNIARASGNKVRNSWQLHRFNTADSLTLQWYMDFKLSPWPWHRFSSLLYEGTYGRMMEIGLRNLKAEASSTKINNY